MHTGLVRILFILFFSLCITRCTKGENKDGNHLAHSPVNQKYLTWDPPLPSTHYSRMDSATSSRNKHLKRELQMVNLLSYMHGNIDKFRKKYSDLGYIIECLYDLAHPDITMLDATAKPESGLLRGNKIWFANYDECKAIHQQVNRTYMLIGTFEGTLKGRHCWAHADHIWMGLCLPAACSYDILQDLIPSWLAVSACEENGPEFSKDSAAIVASVLLSLLGAIIFTGTIVDYFEIGEDETLVLTHRRGMDNEGFQPDDDHKHHIMADGHMTPLHVVTRGFFFERGKLNLDMAEHDCDCKENPKRGKAGLIMRNVLVSFSVYSNLPKMMSARSSSESLGILHAMRVMSMFWIVLWHTFSHNRVRYRNPKSFDDWSRTFGSLAIYNSSFAVDTFFLVSGTLTCYFFMRVLKAGKLSLKTVLCFYCQRYWRLTPPLMIVMMIYTAYWPYIGNGPLFDPKMSDAYSCRRNWWKVLLHINNFINGNKPEDICMSETYYLGVDMQLHLVAPLFLIPLFKFPIFGLIISFLFFSAHFISQGILQKERIVDNAKDLIYARDPMRMAWCRIGVYMVGAMVGYLFYRTDTKMKLNKLLVMGGWILSLFLIGAALFGPYKRETWSKNFEIFYETVKRPAWGIGVAWIIVACVYSYGGLVNKILSWKLWMVLGRVSFALYIVHNKIIYFTLWTSRTTLYFSAYNMAMLYLAHLIVGVTVAFCITLLTEMPILRLECVFLGHNRQENRQSGGSSRPDKQTIHHTYAGENDVSSADSRNLQNLNHLL